MNNNLIDKIKELINFIPLLTILTFAYGYIGFNTFTTIYQIPIVSTDISTIVGIGLFNLTYIAILYLVASPKRKPKYYDALIIYFIFLFLLNNPIYIGSIIVMQLIFSGFFMNSSPKKLHFKELKEKVLRKEKYSPLIEIAIAIIGLVFLIIIDGDYWTLLIFIHVLLTIFHRYKKYKQKFNLYTIIAIILFPVITMYYFIGNSNSNILGLNKQKAQITTETDTFFTTIIFSDANYYYLHNDSLNSVTTLSKNSISKIITTSSERSKTNLIESIKKSFKH